MLELVIGELAPECLALNNPEKVAGHGSHAAASRLNAEVRIRKQKPRIGNTLRGGFG
jgi:hypothetical protein